MIQVGDSLPSSDVFESDLLKKLNIAELVADKRALIFGVVGAFTPACSETHLPGFVVDAEYVKEHNNVEEIICVAVNDPYVMAAWAKEQNVGASVRMVADPLAQFVGALGLTMDLPELGMRSKRFSMIVDAGVVQELNVEPDGTGLTCTLSRPVPKEPSVLKVDVFLY